MKMNRHYITSTGYVFGIESDLKSVDTDKEFFEVDELMVPLIKVFNHKGYITRFSCSSHWSENSCNFYIAFEPWVDIPELSEDLIEKGFWIDDKYNCIRLSRSKVIGEDMSFKDYYKYYFYLATLHSKLYRWALNLPIHDDSKTRDIKEFFEGIRPCVDEYINNNFHRASSTVLYKDLIYKTIYSHYANKYSSMKSSEYKDIFNSKIRNYKDFIFDSKSLQDIIREVCDTINTKVANGLVADILEDNEMKARVADDERVIDICTGIIDDYIILKSLLRS